MYYSFKCVCIANMVSMSHTWPLTNIPHFVVFRGWQTPMSISKWETISDLFDPDDSICAARLSNAMAINAITVVLICIGCVTLLYLTVYVRGFGVFCWWKWQNANMAKAMHALCCLYFSWSSKLNRKVLIVRRGWFFSDPYVFCWYEMCQCSMCSVNTQAGPMLVP